MDKLKSFLGVVKRQHFWILTCLVATVGLIVWWMAGASLSEETEANKNKVIAAQTDVKTVDQHDPHPNETWVAKTEADIDALREKVLSSWDQIYQQQKQIYVWPAELKDDFIEAVEDPERKGVIPLRLRERYQNYVMKELERLATLVDAEWTMQSSAGLGTTGSSSSRSSRLSRGGPLGRGASPLSRRRPLRSRTQSSEVEEEEKIIYKVIWDPANQTAVAQWFDWTEVPTSLQVRYAQEDLWVYGQLGQIVANMNKTAAGPHDAPVREIKVLAVGYDAAEEFPGGIGQNRIFLPESAAGAEGEASGEAAVGEEGLAVKPPRPAGDLKAITAVAGGGEEGVETDPDSIATEWRYVNDQGKPLTAAELTESPPLEYRLMPFQVSLILDQRTLDDLLVEFRNATLPLEVRQVRINPEAVQTGTGGGSSFSSRSSYSSSRSSGAGGTGATGGETGTEAYWVPVEVRGVAYLYNPPDPEKLGNVAEGEESAEDEAAAEDEAVEGEPAEDEAPAKGAAADAEEAEEATEPADDPEAEADMAADAEAADDEAAPEEADVEDAIEPAEEE